MFRDTFVEQQIAALFDKRALPDALEIDRSLLKNVCHLLHLYKKELNNNVLQ